MELSQLRYFCDVASTEHMTKSAHRLHIAQPALSRSIKQLEEEVGSQLFIRVGRNIRLTEEGKLLKGRLQPLLEELDNAVTEARTSSRIPTIRVGIFAASALGVDAIARFMAKEPDVAFQVIQNGNDGHFDVGISTESPARTKKREISGDTCARFTEPIGVMLPTDASDHASAKSRRSDEVDLEDLKHEQFISLAGSRSFRHLCDELCAKRGFYPNIFFDSDSPEIVKKMIALGFGIGFWPEFSWGALDFDGLRWARIRDPQFVRVLRVERTPSADAAKDAVVRGFYDFLTDCIGKAFECDAR